MGPLPLPASSPIILVMSTVPPATIKKIRTLVEIAADLHQGKDFNITRLTILKSLCSDSEATAQFGLYLAKKTQQRMKAQGCPRYTKPGAWQHYQRLVGKGVRGMTKYLRNPTKEGRSSLEDVLIEVRGVQNEYERQHWGPVRIIHSDEVLLVEIALRCVLNQWDASQLGYSVARHYAERYNPHYGTGLIPESAPLVEDIAEFWGRHFLGRGWRKWLAK